MSYSNENGHILIKNSDLLPSIREFSVFFNKTVYLFLENSEKITNFQKKALTNI